MPGKISLSLFKIFYILILTFCIPAFSLTGVRMQKSRRANSATQNAVFHSHFDGVNGGTSFIDQMGTPITRVGIPVTSTAAIKFGSASLQIDQSTTSYLTLPDNNNWFLGTEDFTVELWVYPTTTSIQQYILSQPFGEGGTDMAPFALSFLTTGKFQIAYGQSGVSPWNAYVACSSTSALNTWHHVAIVRNNTSYKLYVNGVNCVNITLPGGWSFGDSNSTFRIGYHNSSYSSYAFSGYIDELLIIKGRAAYTADFSPPTAPY